MTQIIDELVEMGRDAQREASIAQAEAEKEHARKRWMALMYRAFQWGKSLPTHGAPAIYANLGITKIRRAKKGTKAADLRVPAFPIKQSMRA